MASLSTQQYGMKSLKLRPFLVGGVTVLLREGVLASRTRNDAEVMREDAKNSVNRNIAAK